MTEIIQRNIRIFFEEVKIQKIEIIVIKVMCEIIISVTNVKLILHLLLIISVILR